MPLLVRLPPTGDGVLKKVPMPVVPALFDLAVFVVFEPGEGVMAWPLDFAGLRRSGLRGLSSARGAPSLSLSLSLSWPGERLLAEDMATMLS